MFSCFVYHDDGFETSDSNYFEKKRIMLCLFLYLDSLTKSWFCALIPLDIYISVRSCLKPYLHMCSAEIRYCSPEGECTSWPLNYINKHKISNLPVWCPLPPHSSTASSVSITWLSHMRIFFSPWYRTMFLQISTF